MACLRDGRQNSAQNRKGLVGEKYHIGYHYTLVKLKRSYIHDGNNQAVDFVLSRGEVAIEVKGAGRIENADLRPLKAFIEEHHPKKAFVVCNERRPRVHEGNHLLPWRDFLTRLWDGLAIS